MENYKTEVEINASPEAVWKAITNEDAIRQWVAEYEAGMYAVSEWAEGANINWHFKDGSVCMTGTIEKFDAPRHLRTRLRGGDAQPDDPKSITESYQIETTGDGTRLTLNFGPFDEEGLDFLKDSTKKAAQKIKQIAESF